MQRQRRRRSKRIWYVILGVFIAVFLFSFLAQRFKNDSEVDAASTAGFDPGYIISDYQMSNYNSMSEADIQRFLTSKNSCPNTNYNYYLSLSANGKYTWHWANGHFVCLSEERFGDGEVIGSGDTAAHIIWQAAQDYRINPQVLIVLLQKETSLITDPIPNNGDYRKATGYGCPDTAPCSSQYYGFKNQVRKAAALFRTVLDGGWTNYPLGNNYVQYNPNAACGGSVVNIRSLATSALYRYTPYQPNAGALAAGYGTAYCGAYGNRNFYLYFEDWFGGITSGGNWYRMERPRYLSVKVDTEYTNSYLNYSNNAHLNSGQILYFASKMIVDNRMCLRTLDDERKGLNRCVFYDSLEEVNWVWREMETPRYMEKKDYAMVIDLTTRREIGVLNKYAYYTQRAFLPDGDMCLRMIGVTNNECVLYSSLKEVETTSMDLMAPRYLVPKGNTAEIIDPIKNKVIGTLGKDEKVFYQRKIITPGGDMCLLVDGNLNKNACVKFSDLTETWVEMERPRDMRMLVNSYKVNAKSLIQNRSVYLPVNMVRRFVTKRFMLDGEWCLQTEYDFERGTDECIRYKELGEI